MSAIQLHQTLPEASSDQYQPYQSVDFLIHAPGRKLVKNSIRISGDIKAKKNAADWGTPTAGAPNVYVPVGAVDYESNIKLDNCVGAHGFFESFTTETEQKGVIENLQNYGRFVSQVARSTIAADDFNSAKLIAEARGPLEINGNYVLQPIADQAFMNPTGAVPGAEQPGQRSPPSFSIKPMTAFNRMAGGDWSFDKMGYIRVSCILAANNQALFGGPGVTAGDIATYTLENLNCNYVTEADDGKVEPMMLRSYVSVVSSVQSLSTTITARVPSSSVNSVSMSFAEQAHLNDPRYNSYALESLPSFDNISYLFSNSMQNYVTYVVRDDGDALQKGLDSMESSGHSQVSAMTLKANRGTIMGLAFESFIDLSQQRFTVQMKLLSDTITSSPLNAYLFFNTLLQF